MDFFSTAYSVNVLKRCWICNWNGGECQWDRETLWGAGGHHRRFLVGAGRKLGAKFRAGGVCSTDSWHFWAERLFKRHLVIHTLRPTYNLILKWPTFNDYLKQDQHARHIAQRCEQRHRVLRLFFRLVLLFPELVDWKNRSSKSNFVIPFHNSDATYFAEWLILLIAVHQDAPHLRQKVWPQLHPARPPRQCQH